jgi:hypothetical protein
MENTRSEDVAQGKPDAHGGMCSGASVPLEIIGDTRDLPEPHFRSPRSCDTRRSQGVQTAELHSRGVAPMREREQITRAANLTRVQPTT